MKERNLIMNKSLISTAYDLEQLLEKKCKNYETIDDFFNLLGGVVGKYKGFEIKINFSKNEYLLISTDIEGKTVLDELIPVLSDAIGGYEPICEYDFLAKGEKEALPTIEWDIKDPEGRVREIANGRAFASGGECLNIRLFGNRKISDYLEDENIKQKGIRIYGIDPGFLDNKDQIDQLSDVDLYFAIENLSKIIASTIQNASHDGIPNLIEEQYAIEYCAYQTKKFGVELAEPEYGKHILSTSSYEAWYNFYDNHFKKELTDEELSEYQENKKQGKDVLKYMPKGNWKDNLSKPFVKTIEQ